MEMAAGVLSAARMASLAVSISGVAGPGGATPGKPVGMVCFGFSRQTGDGVVTRAATRIFDGDRRQVRAAAVAFALSMALAIGRAAGRARGGQDGEVSGGPVTLKNKKKKKRQR